MSPQPCGMVAWPQGEAVRGGGGTHARQPPAPVPRQAVPRRPASWTCDHCDHCDSCDHRNHPALQLAVWFRGKPVWPCNRLGCMHVVLMCACVPAGLPCRCVMRAESVPLALLAADSTAALALEWAPDWGAGCAAVAASLDAARLHGCSRSGFQSTLKYSTASASREGGDLCICSSHFRALEAPSHANLVVLTTSIPWQSLEALQRFDAPALPQRMIVLSTHAAVLGSTRSCLWYRDFHPLQQWDSTNGYRPRTCTMRAALPYAGPSALQQTKKWFASQGKTP